MTRAKGNTSPMRVSIAGDRYQVTDAVRDVTIERSLLDVWRGRPGVAGECMNARCIIRNAALFPHPVMATSVIKSRVYVIDRPGHVVRYVLSKRDQDLVASHDEESIAAPGTLTLQAPTGNARSGLERHEGGASPRTSSRAKGLARGEAARMLAAVGALDG